MICPECLAPEGIKQVVHVIVECSGSQSSLNKSAIRKKGVKILGVDWPNAQYFCIECGYYEKIAPKT